MPEFTRRHLQSQVEVQALKQACSKSGNKENSAAISWREIENSEPLAVLLSSQNYAVRLYQYFIFCHLLELFRPLASKLQEIRAKLSLLCGRQANPTLCLF